MRTITLELLRHGPAHNQLLSPLTPYMALCENHSAVTLHVPVEHYQFLHRLKALSYKNRKVEDDDTARRFQLTDTARLLGDLLGTIPGLTAESNKPDGTEERLTHLRLILSASELALLPFELTRAPEGLPGSGQHLLLQSQMPVCLTREIRRTGDEPFSWPKEPRILMIAASPKGEIPLQAHLLALRKLITPWVKYFDKENEEAREKRIEDHLVVLTGASIEDIEQKCASNKEKPFTHIHILAHGVEQPELFDTRYYLALHKAQDPNEVDYISGPRLAAALRTALQPDSNPLARPAVVTLASCDSGNVGSVIGAGASIAHALHESGIPLVIASQFPLSFEGSVRLVGYVYEGLMWGIDPRLLLYDLRRRLYTQFPNTHDWASLMAYMSLPSDFSEQLPEIQIQRALQSVNAAMNHADEVIGLLSEKMKSSRSTSAYSDDPLKKGQKDDFIKKMEPLIEEVHKRIDDAKSKLERLLVRWPAKKARISGLLASTEKRQAEVRFRFNYRKDSKAENYDTQSLNLLHKSRNYYWDVFLADRSQSWAVVQYLSLTMVLYAHKPKYMTWCNKKEYLSQLVGDDYPYKKIADLWSMALLLSTYDLNSKIRDHSVWARSNLIELYLLSHVIPRLPNKPKPEDIDKLTLGYTNDLIDIAGRLTLPVYSTRRQILRYSEWFGIDVEDTEDKKNEEDEKLKRKFDELKDLADKIFERFPEEVEEEWK